MKFSIRDLLLVTVIVALALGWGLDHSWQGTKYRRLEGEFRKQQSEWAAEMLADQFEIVRLRRAAGESLVDPLDKQNQQSDSAGSALTPPKNKRP